MEKYDWRNEYRLKLNNNTCNMINRTIQWVGLDLVQDHTGIHDDNRRSETFHNAEFGGKKDFIYLDAILADSNGMKKVID